MSHSDRYDLSRWPHPAPGRAAEETDRLRRGRMVAEEPDEHGRFAETPLVIQVRAAPLPDPQPEFRGWLWDLWDAWFWGRERRHR
jgi:hypothetical protein